MPASLELVKIALLAYANGDSEIALALSGPQVRWDERASRSDGDLVWGQDKVQRAMRRYLDSWEDYRFDVEDLAEVGSGKVVGICRERGKPKDAPAVDRRFGGLWIVEAGKITAWVTYLTPREAVRAAKELLGGHVEVDQIKRTSPPAEVKRIEPASAPAPAPAPAKPEPESVEAAEPIEAPERQAPEPQADRPRKRALTKSEEQKRAARARARLRKQSSRQSA